MAKVFISYSRKDIEFAKRLTGELQKSEMDFWIDWEGIPPTVDWWKEIEKGIEEADMFLFLLSPDSVNSKICGHEIDTAVKNGKRIIPVVVREIKWEETPSELSKLNYIFFTRGDAFDTAVKKVMTAIHTDYEWAATHRRLQVKALEWERKNKENSLLLRGKDLQEAELLLKTNALKEPHPTELQNEYVSTSRKVEEKLLQSVRLRRNIILGASAVSLVIIFLAFTGKLNRLVYYPVDMEGYWVTIPAGEFQMGSVTNFDNEKPIHTVYLDTYQIGKYEITNHQYAQCVKARVCDVPANKIYASGDRESHPVTDVDWGDATIFCEWVDGRLPTEAEWEKAASWDDQTKTKYEYPWGNTIDCSYANYYVMGREHSCVGDTTSVGEYENGKSPYGLYDMGGNVYEWVNDWYHEAYYQESPAFNPSGPVNGQLKVLRGGAWIYPDDLVRSTLRNRDKPTNTVNYVGFRCAKSE